MPFWRQIDEKGSEGITSPGGVHEGNEGGDIEAGVRDRQNTHQAKQPTDRITGHQLFYIFGLDGVGAAVLSGGINFAIAYGMYSTQNLDTHPIRLFQLPNTLAGDAVITIIIQTLITWFIELILVGHDLRNGAIRPIGFVKEPVRPLLRWLMLLHRNETGSRVDGPRSKRWATFVADQAVRVGLIFVVAFFLLWLPAIGILTSVGERGTGDDWDWYFHRQWAPQVFKGVFGGLLALLTTPIIASFWLVREGWRLKREGAAPS
ncbi:yhl026c-like protein [Colletotrichum truncatum]|uniref:Yhl026c-like protein n=1 Tax=Colletotrichum truncatum TaxID=5467 RepID=A0ACC3ZFN4_COLTU|nr:yhl026c-like protein [Colletotrichum truncatum]KAF6801626.1 yhl026c-like protein [Colletotrichum truncatum]